MYVPSTLLKNCLTFYLAKCTVNISALQPSIVFCNYNWYVSIWRIKLVSPLTTRISVFSSFPARLLWYINSRDVATPQYGAGNCENKRLNTGMAPTCDWMIKIVKVNKLYLNSLLVSIVNRVSRSGTMKYQCENTDVSNKKWLLT